MMKALIFPALVAAAVCLSACQQDEPTHTVDWYKSHDKERAAMLTKCHNNPGERAASPNCVNAGKANDEKLNARRGYTDIPKIKW